MIDPVTLPFLCEMCGGRVSELRRGRCWGCYQRWAERRPVGLGATCVVCHDRRRENLRTVELHAAWVAMCHNCAARVRALEPLPDTLEGIRGRLQRDRRGGERRVGLPDPRDDPKERRGLLPRRGLGDAPWIDPEDLMPHDDHMVIVLGEEDFENFEDDEVLEETQIVAVSRLATAQGV
jgi:hypothetical protein